MQLDHIDAGSVLDHLRPLVIVVDGRGRIGAAHGGADGFIGYRPDDFVGRNLLDFVAPAEQSAVATYFDATPGEPLQTAPMPMPFRMRLSGADGDEHDLDVIPTGYADGSGELSGWVVLLVPLDLQSAATISLDAELSGAPRHVVRRRLCEELSSDSSWGRLHWLYVDFESGRPFVSASPAADELVPLVQAEIDDGWSPWTTTEWRRLDRPDGRSGYESAEVEVPAGVSEGSRRWTVDGRPVRMTCVPVRLGDELVGVFLQVGCVPLDARNTVNTNVHQRIERLVDVTRLLEERWRDQDRLQTAATRDPLTGVANRDAFRDALAASSGPVAVLYVDVDRFKYVNDRWGHTIGDRVLTTIAGRIVESVRPSDVVARFGGDEFVVLLPDVDDATATQIGERIVSTAAQPLGWGFGPQAVTVSVGLAPADGLVDVVDAADRAMLRAKREGRARLVHA